MSGKPVVMAKLLCACGRESLPKPEHPYEGSELPLEKSSAGTGRNVHQLRDPCIFVDQDGQLYLYYSIKGEAGIAGARLRISD